jgi:hypothetical protein
MDDIRARRFNTASWASANTVAWAYVDPKKRCKCSLETEVDENKDLVVWVDAYLPLISSRCTS